MNRNIYILIIIILVATGCQKEQHFKYARLNEVSITTDDSSFTVTQLDTLRIKTRITESRPEGAAFTYEWNATAELAGGGATVVLSRKKDLDTVIALSPGDYFLRYIVTDLKTGIASMMQYDLLVNGAFYEGWLVTSNKAGKGMLSFIRMDNTVFLSPAEDVNGAHYEGKALSASAGVIDELKQVIYFTDKGAYRFDANDFRQNGVTTSLFPGGKTFGPRPYYGLSGNATDQYIIDDGALYGALAPLFVTVDDIGTFSDRFPGEYQMFPYVITSTSQFACYFYDNRNKRFMTATYLSRTVNPASGNNPASFNMANVGKTMIACDYGVSGEFYCVMKDDAGYYLYSVTTNTPPYAGIAQPFSNSPDLDKAVAFAASSLLKQVYYAADNRIYLYDVLANSSRLIYEFPAGGKIKDLKMYKRVYRNFNTTPNDPMFNKRIAVAVNNGTNGEVYYFDLNTLGDIVNNTYSQKFTGFGEIVHLDYRNR